MEEKEPWKAKISLLDKRIEGFLQGYRQNVVLIGDDGEEISYLLENYLRLNKSKETVYVHATTSYVSKMEFLKSTIFSLLSELISEGDGLDDLINKLNPELSITTNFIRDILKKDMFSFLDVLEIINKFINESGRKCVFILEEFLGLEKLFPFCFKDFSSFIMLQKDCMLLLTSSSPKNAQKTLSTELNLLFGNFEKVSLAENTFADNYVYFKHCLEKVSASSFFLSFFVNIIGSNIIYYDLIGKLAKENYCQDDEEKSIVAILENALYAKETYFFQKFIKKIEWLCEYSKDSYSLIKILTSLSDGYMRKKELASLEICPLGDLGSKLIKLSDLNYIENLGNIYKIKDSLFSFWLTSVFKFYFSPPFLDPQKRRPLWERKIREEIILHKDDFVKDGTKKILELISSFGDDTLKIGKSTYKLPLIEKTRIISYPKRDFHLLVGEGKEIVFIGIKEKLSEDSDIFEFIEKGAGIKGRKVKKIFISLDRLSPAAKLTAKNHKVIIWDVNEINKLMEVYNKSAIALNPENLG